MNNDGWQQARREAGPPLVRVHDLRHSFGCRLRAAGFSAEDREALLGHANRSMAGHYASADVGRLLKLANLLLNRSGTQTVLRVVDACQGVAQTHKFITRLAGEPHWLEATLERSQQLATG